MKQKNVILMVVAVGCGLVAAFLTAQMSAKAPDQMEVVAAAKDLPVGTMITKEDLAASVKMVRRPKDGLPPTVVLNPEDLVGKRLSRPVRLDEALNSQDLTKNGAITLPEGHNMVSMQVGVGQAAAGFVGPGSRVDVLATVRLGSKLEAFPLLLNMLVVAVGTETAYSKEGTFPNLNMVSFAVKGKEAFVLALAKSRGCSLELILRHPGAPTADDNTDKIEATIKKLSDDQNPAKVSGVENEVKKGDGPRPAEAVKPDPVEVAPAPPSKPEPPAVAMVKVFVAKGDVAPNTEVTKDLIADAFEEKALPKEYAGNALGDLSEALGQYLKTGVAKGQWVTPGHGRHPDPKAPPQEFFQPKPPAEEPKPAEPVKPVVKRKTLDVAMHTATGTVIFRYEEAGPGQWKKVAELSPERAARQDEPEPKPAPAPEKKSD
jgi:Flp pilus assembly protein CpaB